MTLIKKISHYEGLLRQAQGELAQADWAWEAHMDARDIARAEGKTVQVFMGNLRSMLAAGPYFRASARVARLERVLERLRALQ